MLTSRALIKFFTIITLLGLSGMGLISTALYLYLNPTLPPVEVLKNTQLQVPLRIYSNDGKLMGEFGEKFRTPISLEHTPQIFINAILSAEDDRFHQHKGIDVMGLLRAATELISSGKIRSGGSTITMQVARNFFLSNEQTFVRKFNEIFLALKIERSLEKNDILELYLNKIYLGKRAYGVQAAAAIYYGKSIDNLSTAQYAMIAGLPKAPSAYNPINNPARALTRRNWILGRMKKLGFLSQEQWVSATAEQVTASYHGPKLQLSAGYASEMARGFVIERFGLDAYTRGLKVITSIDSELQQAAQHAVAKGLNAYTARHGYRGPETNLAEVNQTTAIKTLVNLSLFSENKPAMIVAFNNIDNAYQLQLLLQDGSTSLLNWDAKHQQTRRFLSENSRTGPIKNPHELFTVGDVIRIQTATDGRLQLADLPHASAALVALQPFDGAIQALVGGYNFQQSKFNRATQAYRQPGSNFKPLIYAAAFNNGFTAAHSINDAPIVFRDQKLETDWRPENSSGKFYGQTTLRRALYLSRNIVSVRLLQEMGIKNALELIDLLELSGGQPPKDLSLALGSHAMTPLEVASMYALFANQGYKIEPYIVKEIRDRDNQLIYLADPKLACNHCDQPISPELANNNQHLIETDEADSLDELLNNSSLANQESDSDLLADVSDHAIKQVFPSAPQIIEPRIAYIIDSILQEVITRGTGTAARALNRSDMAGKTGTTNGPTDAWFSGYHPHLVATTWLGFDNNELLGSREYGGSAALPIWVDFMKLALKNSPNAKRKKPAGINAIKIDRMTGKPPTAKTTQTLFELFREEFIPEFVLRKNDPAQSDFDAIHEELF